MSTVNRPKGQARAAAIPAPGPWMLLTLIWLIWLVFQANALGAAVAPQSPAVGQPPSVWDAARKPVEGWGTREAAAPAAPAPAPKTTPAKASPAKAVGDPAAASPKPAPRKTAVVARTTSPEGAAPVPAPPPPPTAPATASTDAALEARASQPATAVATGIEAPPLPPAAEPVTTERVRAVAAPPPPTAATAPPPAATTAAAAAPAQAKPAAVAEKRPPATGLERLSDEWPAWLKVGVQYRGRTEASRGILVRGDYDTYYLNRIRLSATIVARPWLQAVFQAQDSQVLSYDVGPAPKNLLNSLDMRLGYVAIGTPSGPLFTRVGRQELTFGEGRLIGTPDWGNTNRAYDIARVTAVRPGVKLDFFAGSPVDIVQGGFDPRKQGEDFYGVYATFDKVVKGVVEPFAIVRTTQVAVGELGGRGEGVLYTMGGRIAGRFVPGVDYAADIVVQRGDLAGDPITAWAAHAAFIRTMSQTPGKPRVVIEYNFASGDRDPKDGSRQTFDQLYASNHARYGQADLVGWRNIHHFGMSVEVTPAKPLKLTTGVSRFFLASLGDGLYSASGARIVYARTATSRDVGWEADVAMTYTVSKELSLGAGLGTLFAGPYLEQAGVQSTYFAPYVLWSTKF